MNRHSGAATLPAHRRVPQGTRPHRRTCNGHPKNILRAMRQNFEIGRLIVEQGQQGSESASYGASLIKELSIRLSGEFGKGFSPVNLSLMRKPCLLYRDGIRAAIFQTPSEISGAKEAL